MGNYQTKLPAVNSPRLSLKQKHKHAEPTSPTPADSELDRINDGSNKGTGDKSPNQLHDQHHEESVPVEEECPGLSENQKKIIVDTWKVLEEDIARVGVIVFINLFETHPDVQDVFMPFSGVILEDLKQSKQFRAHALRVMGFVQKAVARLNEPEKLVKLLQELGKNHVAYGAKAVYMDYIGPQFILAIRPSLESQWNQDIHEAWAQLFRVISFVMKGAMTAESSSPAAITPTSPTRK